MDHDVGVGKQFRSTRRTCLLIFVALLSVMVTPQAFAAWQCEGRSCGTTPWVCCCESPAEQRDENCRPLDRPLAGETCPSECQCVMVKISNPVTPAAGFSIAAVAPLALLHHSAPQTPSATMAILERITGTRGPPVLASALGPPSFRGPPPA